MAEHKPQKSKQHAVGLEPRQHATVRNSKISPLIEVLEPRVLFSADAFGLPVLGLVENDASLYDTGINDHMGNSIVAVAPLELIFLDPTLPQSDLILDDLTKQKSEGRNLEVVILSSDTNGLDTISNALTGKSNVSSIHIISHGTNEGVQLGDTWLNIDAIAQYKNQLNQWQSSLTEDADMLIYGCNLAASADGIALLDALAAETNTDIAASIDSTGHDNLGANWSLEYSNGSIDSDIALTVEAQLSWENELAAVLAAAADDLGQQHYNTPFIVTDSTTFDGSHNGIPIDVTGNDSIDGGTINLVNVLNEKNGSVNANPNNTFTFTPDTDHQGLASFDYIVTDDHGTLENHWSLDNTAIDETGNNNGTLYGEFGNNGHIDLQSINYPDSFTLSFEFKVGSIPSIADLETFFNLGLFAYNGTSVVSTSTVIWIGIIDGELVTSLRGMDDTAIESNIIENASQWNDENWHSYTLTVDNSGSSPISSVYIDGNLKSDNLFNNGAGGFNVSRSTILGMTETLIGGIFNLEKHDMQNVRIYDGVKSFDIDTVTLDLQKHVGPSINIRAPAIELDEDSSHSPTISIDYTGEATDQLTANVVAKHGSLTNGLNPIPPGATAVSQDSNQLSVSGTKAQVEDILNSIVYTPIANYHGSDTIEIQVDLDLEFQLDATTVHQSDSANNTKELFVNDPDRGEVLNLENGEYARAIDSFAGAQELTFSAWVNLDQASARGAEVLSVADKAGLRLNYTQNFEDSNQQVFKGLTGFFHNEDENDWVSLSHDIDLQGSGWHHVAYSVADGYQRLYLDGAIVAQSSITASQDKDIIWFGGPQERAGTFIGVHADNQNHNFDFNGKIDDARLHSRLLSEDEIATLADPANGQPSGASKNINVDINAVNDAPAIQPESSSVTFSETINPNDSIPVVISSNIEITDIESEFPGGGLNGASVTIQRADPADNTAPLKSPFDSFFYKTVDLNNEATLDNSLVPGQAIIGVDFATVTSNSEGLLSLEFNNNATTQNVSEFLQTITYRNISDAPPQILELLWTFNDAGLDIYNIADPNAEEVSTSLSFVNIATVNHPLEVKTNIPLTVGFDTTTNILTSTLETIDPESDPSEIVYKLNSQSNIGYLEKYIPGSPQPEPQRLSPDNAFTQADINSSFIRYVSIEDNSSPQTDIFQFSVRDGKGSNIQTALTIETDILTDPPILTPGPGLATYTELTAPVILDSGITVTDAELDVGNYEGATLSISRYDNINNLAIPNADDQIDGNTNSGGNLDLDNGNIIYAGNNVGTYTNTFGTLELEFNATANSTIANSVLRSITYSNTSNNPTPLSNDTETVFFQWQFSDESSTVSTITPVALTSINEAPSSNDKTVNLNEDTEYEFSDTDFDFYDIDADSFNSVVIITPPTYGQLLLSGSTVVANQSINVNSIPNLRYIPSLHSYGTANDSFTFHVQDDGEQFNGGQNTSTATNQFTFNIASVNDAPMGSDNTLTTPEDTTLTFAVSDFGYTDIDNNTLLAVRIDSLPSKGTLMLPNTEVVSTQTISSADISDLEFIPEANANGLGYDTFSFTVQDDGGTANGGTATAISSNNITIDVTSINDAPTGTDNTVSGSEDTPYTFNPADFGFSDSDNNSFDAVIIETLPTNGQLTIDNRPVSLAEKIQFSEITKLSLSAQAEQSGVAYDSFEFLVRDNGGVDNGGLNTSTNASVMTIDIKSVNDEPSGTNKTIQLLEDNTYVFTATDFGFTDLNDNNSLKAVHIKTLPGNGELKLNNLPVSAGQVITASDVTALIFTPISDSHGNIADHFTFAVQDDGGVENNGIDTDTTPNQISFDLMSVNDPPEGRNNTLTTPEDTELLFTANDFGYSDLDSNIFQAVRIDTLPANGQLILSGAPVTSGQVISIANISLLKFIPAPNVNQAGYDAFSFSVQDNGGTTNGGFDTALASSIIKINVTSVNDAPAGTDSTVSTLEDSTYQFSPADFGFTDSDNNSFMSVLIEPPVNGQLTLSGLPLSSSTEILYADISSLQFTPQTDQFGVAYSAFDFAVRDNGGVSNGGEDTSATTNVMTLNIGSVNDAPSGKNNTITLHEDSTYVFTPVDFGFSDPVDGHDLSSVTINTLPGNGTLNLTDNSVVVINQRLDASQISNLVFTPANNAHGSGYDNFTFTVQDNGGAGNGGIDTDQSAKTITFNVLSVNDAPNGSDSTIITAEDTAFTFTALDFGFIDNIDNTDELHSIEITTLPAGQLLLSGSAVSIGQTIESAAIEDLTYRPLEDVNGANIDSFTFLVRDKGGTLHGGADTSTKVSTISVNVSSANDAPTSTDTTVTGLEDTPYRFEPADFAFNDPDNNGLMSVFIETLPEKGQLTLANEPVFARQEIAFESLSDLTFLPLAHQNDPAYSTFEFSVRDNGGINNGGIDKSVTTNVMTVDIIHVNDAPVGQNNTIDILEDTAHTFSTLDFGFSDPEDNDNFSALVISDLPVKGKLELSGVAVTAGQIIDASLIPALQFVPEANISVVNYDNFAFQVQDNGGELNNGINTDPSKNTITFNVTPVNNAPAGTDGTISTIEDTPYQFSEMVFGFSDPDEHQFSSLEITSLPTYGQLSLNDIAVTAGQVINASSIANLLYTPPADGFGIGLDEFKFIVHDDGGVANNGIDSDPTPNTITINVNSANDSPAGTDNTITLNEDTRHQFTVTDFGFSDSDGHKLQSIMITALPDVGQLLLENVAVTTGHVIAANSVASLEFVAPANAFGSALSQFEFAVQDNGGLLNNGSNTDPTPNSIAFDIISVNDAPQGTDKIVSTTEDTALTFSINDFGFNDIDGNSLESIRIDTLPGNGQLALAGVPVALQQVIHKTQIANLVFTPEPDISGNGYDTFSFSVQDNGGLANSGNNTATTSNAVIIDVLSINDAPSSTDNTVLGFEDTLYNFSVDDFAFSDLDNNHFNSIIIESLPTRGQLTIVGNQVTIGDEIPYASINDLGFTPQKNHAGAAYTSFTFTVRDDGGTTNGGIDESATENNITIDITAVNDAPSGSDTTITMIEDTPRSFTAFDFGFTDAADNNNLLSVSISTLPGNGQLLLDNEALVPGQVIASSSIPSLVFVPSANANGISYDNFTFQVQDDGGTDHGGRDLDNSANTITIDVIAQSDPPVGLDSSVGITDDQQYTLSRIDFDFTDIDNDALAAIRIDSVPPEGAGQLLLSNKPVSTGIIIDIADIDNGKLVFIPAEFDDQAEQSSFTYSLIDSGSTQNNGQNTAIDANEMAFEISQAIPQFSPALEASVLSIEAPAVEKKQEIEEPTETVISEEASAQAINENGEANANLDTSFDNPPTASLTNGLTGDPITLQATEAKATIFRDFDLLSASIENHRTFKVESLTDAGAVIDVQESSNLADLFYTEERNSLTSSNLLKKLSQEREQIKQDITLDAQVLTNAVSVSTGLSIGYVIWLVRGGLLLGSVMSAMPAWRNIDPLPVLSSMDGDSDNEDDESLEELVDTDDESDSEKHEHQQDKGQEN